MNFSAKIGCHGNDPSLIGKIRSLIYDQIAIIRSDGGNLAKIGPDPELICFKGLFLKRNKEHMPFSFLNFCVTGPNRPIIKFTL